MNGKRFQVAGLFTLLAAGLLLAKDFWEKPYTEWKKSEVDKMLQDSPWSKSQTIVDQVGGRGSGIGGEKELSSNFAVRFFSAIAVRQAYVRQLQLMNNYDSRSEAEKAEIDAKFGKVLRMDFSSTIVVALEFSTNDRERSLNVKRFLDNVRVDLLKQSCYLISDRLGRVEIKEYYPPSPDGSGAKFVFPRMVEDKPVVTAEDREVKFDMYVPPVNQRVFITFKVKNMVIDSQVSL